MMDTLDYDLALKQLLPSQTIALILAGGKGSRLKNLTSTQAKPAVHFGGQFRIIDFTLSNCLNSNIKRIGVLTQYQSYSLINHLRLGWSFLDKTMNEFIDLLPAEQRLDKKDWYEGTANAVYQNIDFIERSQSQYIVILAGDHVYKMDYAKMLIDHVKQGAKCTIASIKVKHDDAHDFGILSINNKSKVIEFIEKPINPPTVKDDPEYALASMGIYIFDKEYLCQKLRDDCLDKTSEHDFGKNIIPSAVNEGAVWAHSFEKSCISNDHNLPPYWRDVGTIDAYWKSNIDLVHTCPQFDLYDNNWPIRTYVEPKPPAKFILNAEEISGQIHNSLISPGCIIASCQLINSILFDGVNVSYGSIVDSSVLLPNVKIGKNCILRKCVIDSDCHLPDNLVVGIDHQDDEKRFYRSEQGVVLITQTMLENLTNNEGRKVANNRP